MGISGAGKTTLAQKIVEKLTEANQEVKWFNADNIRSLFDDWDFSYEGRMRQAHRMADHADSAAKNGRIAIVDFICPTEEFRATFHKNRPSDLIIWMDRTKSSKYKDTDALFEAPSEYDYRICDDDTEGWAHRIVAGILDGIKPPQFDIYAPTAQLLGRYQPWHDGHTALFERALEKTGQVVIEVRACQGWNNSNPFDFKTVEASIHRALSLKYSGRYMVIMVPNITEIVYGRDVGYKITQESLGEDIESISATKIRKTMGFDT
jgi:adenylylsulfate kinase